MNLSSFKLIWKRLYERDSGFFAAEIEPFADWESTRHAGIAHIYLDYGLQALYGDAPASVARKFFVATVEMVDRAEREEKFEKDPHSNFGFPHNRAVALRARAHAKALLGQGLCVPDLNQASLDFETWCGWFTRREWDPQGEANYLAGVRTALLAGERERFSSLLQYKWPFKWHTEEHILYLNMSEAFQTKQRVFDPALVLRFRNLFDAYRNPEFKPDIFLEQEIIRFEFGVMWRLFFEGDVTFSTQRVVDVISA
jgi:hypothetical protein